MGALTGARLPRYPVHAAAVYWHARRGGVPADFVTTADELVRHHLALLSRRRYALLRRAASLAVAR